MHLQSLLPAALFAVSAIFSIPAPAAAAAADLHAKPAATVVEHSDIASGTVQSSQRLAAAEAGTSNADGAGRGKTDEAEIIIEDSRRNLKVTRKDFADCMKDWGPQTQMSKDEWAASCRSTLEYFPAAP